MRCSRQIFPTLLLAAILLAAGSISPAAAQESLTPGTPVNGTLSGEPATYTITADAGQMIMLRVESEAFDAQVALADAGGDELARDDDGGGGSNALLAYIAQTEGTFTAIVSAWGGGRGAFTLTPEIMTPPMVELGQTAQLDIIGKTVTYVAFTASANNVVNLHTLSSDEEDLRLTLYGVDGQELASDDDSGRGTTPYLRRVVLPDDGIYLVKIDSVFDEAVTTAANITIEATERLYLTSTPQQVTLGDAAAVSLEVFDLEVSAGTTYRIVVSNESGGSIRLELGGTDEFFTPTLNADAATRIAWDYQAQTSGSIRVILYADFFSEASDYAIWLEPVE